MILGTTKPLSLIHISTEETAYQNNNPSMHTINHYFGNIATQLYNNTNYVGYYTFQGTKGQLFRAMASSSELGHWRLGLTFPNGITYYTREGYKYKEPHQDALIERTLDETGTYTVRIYSQEETYNGKDWPAAGHYTIQSNIELTPTRCV